MTAVLRISARYLNIVLLFLSGLYADCLSTDFQLCHMCKGMIQNDSAVWSFCQTTGRVEGRCCCQLEKDNILGLDLSNCSLNHIEDLQAASVSVVIDLSSNPISNLSDNLFQGFSQLAHLILPIKLECPGGNTSWDRVDIKHDTRLCEGQRNACNKTGRISLVCPENSHCMPYGPGFTECSCADNFHGYRCLREGQFPMIEVMGILAGATVVVSTLLWVTQRRRVKSI